MDSIAPDRARALAALLLAGMLLCSCAPAATPPGPTLTTPAPAATAAPLSTARQSTPVITLAARLTPIPACDQPGGRLEQRELASPNLPRPLRVDVYLPPCYDDRRPQPYPLLVLLHGQGFDRSQWARLGALAAADRLAAQGEGPSFLIVLPDEEDNLKNPFETGYEAALVDDLLPWLEQEYHACGERICRAIGGLSRGASWAVRIGLIHPQSFAAVGAHSLPTFYGDPAQTPDWVAGIPAGQAPRLWLDTGEHDRYRAQAQAYSELLTRLGLAHEWRLWPGEHDEDYWSAHVEDYLRWYSQAVNLTAPGLDY